MSMVQLSRPVLRRAPLLACVLGVLALPASAPAAPAGFGAPIALQAATLRTAGEPVVSVAGGGGIVAAWDQQLSAHAFGVVARRGTTAGRFGAAERLTSAGFEPSAAAGRDGGAAVIWETDARGGTRSLQVAVARGHARFGHAQTLMRVRANVTSQQVLASGDRYVAIWWQGVPGTGGHAVRYAVSDTRGHFGAARTLAPRTGPLTGVTAAAGPDGTVTAAWGTPLGGTVATNQQLAYARLAPGTAVFGPVGGLRALAADAGAETESIGVAAGPGGTALTWTEAGQLPELLRTAPLAGSAAAAPQTVFTLDSDDLGKRYAVGPVLALPGAGAPVAAWSVQQSPGGESEAITGGSVFAARAGADGTFPAGTQLSAAGTIATQAVSTATRSTSVIAWSTGRFPRYGLQYATAGSAGFSAAQPLTGGHAERGVQLASSAGAAVAIWVSRPGPGGAHPQGGLRGISIAILRDAA